MHEKWSNGEEYWYTYTDSDSYGDNDHKKDASGNEYNEETLEEERYAVYSIPENEIPSIDDLLYDADSGTLIYQDIITLKTEYKNDQFTPNDVSEYDKAGNRIYMKIDDDGNGSIIKDYFDKNTYRVTKSELLFKIDDSGAISIPLNNYPSLARCWIYWDNGKIKKIYNPYGDSVTFTHAGDILSTGYGYRYGGYIHIEYKNGKVFRIRSVYLPYEEDVFDYHLFELSYDYNGKIKRMESLKQEKTGFWYNQESGPTLEIIQPYDEKLLTFQLSNIDDYYAFIIDEYGQTKLVQKEDEIGYDNYY